MIENFEKKTTKTLTEIQKKLSEHDKKFTSHDEKFDRVVNKLLDHDDKFEQIEDQIKQTEDRILSAIDTAMKKMTNVDEEHVMIRATLDRHEDEIIKIKKVVKLA
ncbi:MAG: hypothetical protein WCG99_02030 [Candidatus Berkelbacteria bacterium]